MQCYKRSIHGGLLERPAVAAHGVALEVGEHQHRRVGRQVGAHIVLLDALAPANRQGHLPGLVEDVHRRRAGPAVLAHGLPVGLGGVAPALVGGVALHDRVGSSSPLCELDSNAASIPPGARYKSRGKLSSGWPDRRGRSGRHGAADDDVHDRLDDLQAVRVQAAVG